MSLSASFFQKDLLNAFNSDGTTYNIQSNGAAEQNSLLSHTIQLSAEQATQLGLKFYDTETDLSGEMAPTDQVFNLPQTSNNLEDDVIHVNEDLNLHRIFKNPNMNSQSFVIKPVANNTSALNRNAQFRKTMDEISELLSFNNDEEGTVYLQNNMFNNNQQTSQYNPPIKTQASNADNSTQQVKYVLPNTVNTSKPYKLVAQPINRTKVNYTNQTITLPNSQKISLQNLLNQKSVETKSTDLKRPVSVVPIKKQNRVKSILFKPTIVPISTQGNTTNIINTNTIALNSNSHSILNQTKVPKLIPINNERKTTVIRSENIPRTILPLPNNNSKVPNPVIDNLPFKIEYRLDLVDNYTNSQNSALTTNISNSENPAKTDSTAKSTEPINNALLNKTVSLTSKIENSIVPLSAKKKNIEPESKIVQEALQKYPVNSSKPLGSTDNPIKLVQKGHTFHSLQSLNESQLTQIAGALKHRPPHQQSGDREPHKVVLYDSATHTRIIYRIVYPDELNLKPGPDTEDGKTKVSVEESNVQKEKRKRKMKLNPVPETPIAQENKQPLARTRTGRIIRPPNRIINDYKRLRLDDTDKEEWIDLSEEQIPAQSVTNNVEKQSEVSSQDVSVDQVSSETSMQESANVKPPTRTRSLNSKFRCPTCNKIYLGYGRMSKHLAMYPDHAELDQLGIDPPAKSKLKKNYSFKPKPNSSGFKSDENKEESDSLNTSDKSDEGCTKTLFECLSQKIDKLSGPEKWSELCNQLTGFVQDVQTFMQSEVISNNSDNDIIKKDISQVTINDTISRITNLKPGKYNLKESFLSKESNDTTIPMTNSCSSSPMKLILDDYNQQLTNNIVDNLNIDFERNVLSNSRSELQRQMDILINEDACQNLSSLSESHNSVRDNIENINTIRDSMNLSSEDGIVFQNVDDLVHESLKNLTADEIAAVPPLEHSPDDLVNSQSSLQDLSLDLFQFHHN